MSGRSVPHAHPATAEYEFANPSRLGEQRFGEGMAQTPFICLPPPLPEILGWPPNGAGLHPIPGLTEPLSRAISYPSSPLTPSKQGSFSSLLTS